MTSKEPHIHIVGHESDYDDSHIIQETEDDFYRHSSPDINFYRFCPECGALNNTKFRGKRWDRYHQRKAKKQKPYVPTGKEVPISEINQFLQKDQDRIGKQLAEVFSRPSPFFRRIERGELPGGMEETIDKMTAHCKETRDLLIHDKSITVKDVAPGSGLTFKKLEQARKLLEKEGRKL